MSEGPKRVAPNGQSARPATPEEVEATGSIKALATKQREQEVNLATLAAREGTLYIRNIRAIQCRVTLDTGRSITLEPRGNIGDVAPVSPDEQYDSKFIINRDLLYEVIPVEQAAKIIRKQAINAQSVRNPLFEMLRSETGKVYTPESIVTEKPVADIVVGRVEDAADGKNTQNNTEIVREVVIQDTRAPERAAVPGSMENPLGVGSADISPDDVREFLIWKQEQRLRKLAEAESDEVVD
jgi:hypothetical protein